MITHQDVSLPGSNLETLCEIAESLCGYQVSNEALLERVDPEKALQILEPFFKDKRDTVPPSVQVILETP